MSENTITGKIIHVLELVSGDSRNRPGEKWYRQEYVLETMEEYPRKVCFQLWGKDRIDGAAIQLGDTVRVTYQLESREFNGRWYTSVNGRMVDKMSDNMMPGANPYTQTMPHTDNNFGGAPQTGFGAPQNPNQGFGQGFNQGGSVDDLPF